MEEDKTLMEPQPQVVDNQEATQSDDKVNEVDVWAEDFDPSTVDNDAESIDNDTEDDMAQEEIDPDTIYKKQLESDKKLPEPIFIKYKGKVVDVQDVNELRDLAERGIAATYKLQEAAEIRKQYEGITPEDIELLKRFKSGDTSVIEQLAEPLIEVDTTSQAVEEVANEILASPYADLFRESVSVLPPADKNLLSNNPQILGALKEDFDKGIAQKIMPKAQRYVAINGLSFLEAYQKAGDDIFGSNSKADEIKAQPEANTSVSTSKPVDVWSMDSDTFKKLMNNHKR